MRKFSGSLDANVLLRLVLGDIPEQSEIAFKLLERSKALLISDIALVEVVFALERYYEVPRAGIVEIIEALSNNPKLVFNAELMEQALKLYPNHPKLSFEDCCLAAYARHEEAMPLWTFDRKLGKQAAGIARVLSYAVLKN